MILKCLAVNYKKKDGELANALYWPDKNITLNDASNDVYNSELKEYFADYFQNLCSEISLYEMEIDDVSLSVD